MVDARRRRLGDFRLGVVGDAQAGRHDHLEIVGAVAGGQGLVRGEPERAQRAPQRGELGVAAEDRLGHLAGELAVGAEASVLAWVSSKPIMAATRRVNSVKPPETRQVRAPCARMVATSVRAGVRWMRVGDNLVDHGGGQPLQQCDALAQRRREFDFAAHGPLGDRGDMRLEADIVGKFVDAFLPIMVESMSARSSLLRRACVG